MLFSVLYSFILILLSAQGDCCTPSFFKVTKLKILRFHYSNAIIGQYASMMVGCGCTLLNLVKSVNI